VELFAARGLRADIVHHGQPLVEDHHVTVRGADDITDIPSGMQLAGALTPPRVGHSEAVQHGRSQQAAEPVSVSATSARIASVQG